MIENKIENIFKLLFFQLNFWLMYSSCAFILAFSYSIYNSNPIFSSSQSAISPDS